MIIFYRAIINLIILLSPIIILIRLFKKKEHPTRFKEKFCFFSKKKKEGKLIWFHGASVGEILSIMPLIERLEKNKKISQILVTSSTLSSANLFKKFKLKKTIHQFFPIDSNFFTKKFLSFWKPSLAIFIDSEIWPNMLTNLKNKSIPHILLNARITKKSYNRWMLINFSSKYLFKSFDATFPQNIETFKFLKSLGAKKVKFLGNLKFSENEYDLKKSINLKLKKFLEKKIHWCASSTHNGEEMMCIDAHINLRKKYKNLVTIIIPRHVQRVDQLVSSIKNLELNVHRHSSYNKINQNTEIYIVDTYGETKSFFKISKTVFLGGSIIKHGGQNPLEAARYGCKIIHGSYINNFKEIYKLLNQNNFAFKIVDIKQLTNRIEKRFKEKNNSKIIVNKIKKLGNKTLNSTLTEIDFFLNKK